MSEKHRQSRHLTRAYFSYAPFGNSCQKWLCNSRDVGGPGRMEEKVLMPITVPKILVVTLIRTEEFWKIWKAFSPGSREPWVSWSRLVISDGLLHSCDFLFQWKERGLLEESHVEMHSILPSYVRLSPGVTSSIVRRRVVQTTGINRLTAVDGRGRSYFSRNFSLWFSSLCILG